MNQRTRARKWVVSCARSGVQVGLATLAMAQGDGFPWDRVIGVDVSTLDEAARARVVELARSTPNYHGCRGSVAECMATDPPNRIAQRLAGFLARRVLDGWPDDRIAEAVAERRRSARPRLIAEVDVAEAPCIGAETAPVTVVEFGDFECPFCRVASPILESIAESNGGVRFCFKHFPIRTHPRGVPSSVAALAAHRQGRFWAMHDALYATAPDLSDEALERAAQVAGLDMDQFQRHLVDEDLVEEVMADKFEGLELGVDRTPTVFVNGKRYVGELNEVELTDRIEEEIDMVE